MKSTSSAAAVSIPAVADSACGSLSSAACRSDAPPIAAVTPARAATEAMKDFVAATLFSAPALRPRTISACFASGLSVTLTTAIVVAPPFFAASCNATISGLAPDCETVKWTPPFRCSAAP
ncbi:hypothetical protein ACVIEM_000565 [Rhizobium leguminosarum]